MITKETYVRSEVKEILKKGIQVIAPLWSLENFVAVNPYLGMSSMDFDQAMNFLNKSASAEATLPIAFYREALENGKLLKGDIAKSLEESNIEVAKNTDDFIEGLYANQEPEGQLKVATLVEVASEINGKKWGRFMVDRISFWASSYFDDSQAIWKTTKKTDSLFDSWKKEAEVDLSPETMGLKGFRKFVKSLPDDHVLASSYALSMLDVPEEMHAHYLSSLLMKMNGWAGFAARVDWDAKLKGSESNLLEEFLAVMLVWEVSIKELLSYPELDKKWEKSKIESIFLINSKSYEQSFGVKLVLQRAYDISNQRSIISKINQQESDTSPKATPSVQAVFCIDVRSEVMRRNLEEAHQDIETLGFAGFFGFPIKYKSIAHEEGTDQCPVLLSPSHNIKERVIGTKENENAVESRRLYSHLNKAIKTFKSGAISCFSFVSPLGLFFLPKLITDSLSITRPVSKPSQSGLSKAEEKNKCIELNYIKITSECSGITLEDRVKMAAGALKGMSLTDNFAPIVMLVGHGASTTNNPQATGLDCGACGGHSGESNAKVAATVLNDAHVREELARQGIDIPNSTVFIAALHDTTTDEISTFGTEKISSWHKEILEEFNHSANIAGEASRKERAARMNINNSEIDKSVIHRSKDWSQVRPEWGLAGCSSFIVAPRERTKSLNLGGKSFMHNYSWKNDKDFDVLELIMTAPMVVTSWINLQYYASTVDNKRFGSGNKTLHNVVGGLGVLEGFGGDLRVGLSFQSVHDGDQYQHEPQRLNVMIEAPVDEMSKILEKHESIRQLCDNEWIFLFAMNELGKVAYKYIGNLEWELIE